MSPGDNPYAVPKTATSVATPGTLTLEPGEQLPPVCLKCGTTEALTARSERINSLGLTLVVIVLAVLGGVFLPQYFEDVVDRDLVVTPLVILAAAVLGWIANRLGSKGNLNVPVCTNCNQRWTDGRKYNRLLLPLMIVSIVAMNVGSRSEIPALLLASLVGLIAIVVLSRKLNIKSRILGIRAVGKGKVLLTWVDPTALEYVHRHRTARG